MNVALQNIYILTHKFQAIANASMWNNFEEIDVLRNYYINIYFTCQEKYKMEVYEIELIKNIINLNKEIIQVAQSSRAKILNEYSTMKNGMINCNAYFHDLYYDF